MSLEEPVGKLAVNKSEQVNKNKLNFEFSNS